MVRVVQVGWLHHGLFHRLGSGVPPLPGVASTSFRLALMIWIALIDPFQP